MAALFLRQGFKGRDLWRDGPGPIGDLACQCVGECCIGKHDFRAAIFQNLAQTLHRCIGRER